MKKLIKLRREVNRLFFNHHLRKSAIAKMRRVSRNFVIKWRQFPNQGFEKDSVAGQIAKIYQNLTTHFHLSYDLFR